MDVIFEQHPNLEQYFKTSDGECFYLETDAKDYAKILENKEVEIINNPSLFVETTEVETDVTTIETPIKVVDASKNKVEEISSETAEELTTTSDSVEETVEASIEETPASNKTPKAEK